MFRITAFAIILLLLSGCKSKGLHLYEYMGLNYSILNIDGVPREIYIDSINEFKSSELDSLIYCFYLSKCQSEENNYIEIFAQNRSLHEYSLFQKKNNIIYRYEFNYFDYQLNIKSKKSENSDLMITSQKYRCE